MDKHSLLTWVEGYPTSIIIHSAVLRCLDTQAVERSLWLGRVYDKTGNIMRDWHTVHAREIALCRGNNVHFCRYCDTCGCLLYQASGRRFGLFPAPSEQVIYGGPCELIAHERLVSDEIYRYRRKLSIWRLGVLERPPDGLPEHVEFWKSP